MNYTYLFIPFVLYCISLIVLNCIWYFRIPIIRIDILYQGHTHQEIDSFIGSVLNIRNNRSPDLVNELDDSNDSLPDLEYVN